MIDDESKVRIVIPAGEVTTKGQVAYVNGNAATYSITLTAYEDPPTRAASRPTRRRTSTTTRTAPAPDPGELGGRGGGSPGHQHPRMDPRQPTRGPTMPKFDLAAFIERRQRESAVEIDLGDGTTVTIPAPELWSDDVAKSLARGDTDAALDALLGDDGAMRWRAQGGTWSLLNAVYIDSQGSTPGNRRPPRAPEPAREAVQADLLQFYGVDLLDIGTPALSWRRADVLIRQLPREARLTQEMHPAQRWSQTDYLLALVADLLNLANWQRLGGPTFGVAEAEAAASTRREPGQDVRQQEVHSGAAAPSAQDGFAEVMSHGC